MMEHLGKLLNSWVGAAVGITTLLGIFTPAILRWYTTKVKPMFCGPIVLDKLEEVSRTVAALAAEMQPNGGSTVRDSLNRIENMQLQHSEKLRAVFTTLPFGVFEVDKKGSAVWSNRILSRMTGRTPQELRGFGWINFIAYEERDRVKSNWESCISSETEFEDKVTIETPDGNRIQVSMQSMKMEGRQGRPIGYIVTVTGGVS